MAKTKLQLGVIGLGTMGANLARNAASRGAHVAVFNRTTAKTEEFMEMHRREGDFTACKTLKDLVDALETPRPILLMVKAGSAVDAVVDELLPLLSKGDVLIDAGNSHFDDTERREKALADKGIRFVGMGVSGGEEGALRGPSMMPGGAEESVRELLPLLSKMAASDGEGGACVAHVGPGGAGHFVKMVHNGIEYAMMQAIAEIYHGLRALGRLSHADLAELFAEWKDGKDVGSFLVEITADIFRAKDPDTGKDLLDVIADRAGQKGTGKWTTAAAMDFGVAVPSITAAVDARILSGDAGMRETGKRLALEKTGESVDAREAAAMARSALELTMILAYVQGFELIKRASGERKWGIDLSETARIWRGGCIIRSAMLPAFQRAMGEGGDAARAELEKRFSGKRQKLWRQFVALGVGSGVPMPTLSATLAYFDGIRSERLPLSLIQAQRDYFGAHTYERTDRPGAFHSDWSAVSR